MTPSAEQAAPTHSCCTQFWTPSSVPFRTPCATRQPRSARCCGSGCPAPPAASRAPDRWRLASTDAAAAAAAEVEIDADTLWRLATRGITPQKAQPKVDVSGDETLAATVLNIVSIIWEPVR